MADAAATYPPVTRPFFGGAIQASLPVEFRDIAAVRQVPDNQECWQDVDRGVLLVVELLEMDASRDLRAAAQDNWKELCVANESEPEDISSFSFTEDSSVVRSLPETAQVCHGVGYQHVRMGRAVDVGGNPREQEVRQVRVELALLRLPSVRTDILLTLSTPSGRNPQEEGTTVGHSVTFRNILATLAIRDWSLFGSEHG